MENFWIRLDDPRNGALDSYFRLTGAQMRSKLEPEKGIFIAEAQTVIDTALDAGCFPLSVLCDPELMNERANRTVDRCRRINPDLRAYLLPHDKISKTTGFELTRGMLCEMRRPAPQDPCALLEKARRVAVLERICDSTNVGAIFRSAAGIGIDAVLLTPDCCDPLIRRSVRVSMGTVFHVPFAYIPAFPAAFGLLGRSGFRTVALALRRDAVPIDDPRLKREEKLALILGSEGYGLTDETIGKADYTAIIPMKNGVDSLNVAAAGALAFWELRVR